MTTRRNIALLLAKPAGMKPRDVAEALVATFGQTQHVSKVEIAGPGFINFTISTPCRLATIRRVFELGADYGKQPEKLRESVTVEFVSANPNGPLHVGHGRGAAYGASVANLLEATGHPVQREYYVNDAGRQMDILAVSVWLRYHELGGVNVRFPDNGYKGDYVVDIARSLRGREGDRLRHTAIEISDGLPADESQGGDKELHVDALIARAKQLLGEADYRIVFNAGLDWCLADIRNDLAGFGVVHDNFFSERSLATDGYVKRAIDTLRTNGHLYEDQGATWFRATTFGDDKDRVVVRENGVTTYFASDLGYLLSKFERGFDRALYILGADHHGYIARLKAAAQGLGLDPAQDRGAAGAVRDPVPRRRTRADVDARRQFRHPARAARGSRHRCRAFLLRHARQRPAPGFRPGAGQEPYQRQPGVLHPVRACAHRQPVPPAQGKGPELQRQRGDRRRARAWSNCTKTTCSAN